MDERIYQSAEHIIGIRQKAYEVYLPLVEDVCSRTVSEAELSHLLDYLQVFACDEKILGLYKKVCRKYLYIRGASNFILKRIGKCGRMKTNDYSAEYI